MRPALSLSYELLKIALEILAWVMIPPVAFMFAGYFSQALFGTDTLGQLATITTFLVAAVAGIRGAMRAEAKIKSFMAQWQGVTYDRRSLLRHGPVRLCRLF